MCLAPARLLRGGRGGLGPARGLGPPGPARAGSRGSVVGIWRGMSVGTGAETRAWRGAQPQAKVWPGFGPWAGLGVFGTLRSRDRCQFRPWAPAAPPRPRLTAPTSAVTYWLLGGGALRRSGRVAAVHDAQVWRAPVSPKMRNREELLPCSLALARCSHSVLGLSFCIAFSGTPPRFTHTHTHASVVLPSP